MADTINPGGTQTPQAAPSPTRLAYAKRRVDAMKGFYIHLAIFGLVLAGLFIVNALTGGSWWVQWVLLGWGIGVVAHAAGVFGRTPRAIADWEQRKVNEIARQR